MPDHAPQVVFATGVAHVMDVGPNVVMSFSSLDIADKGDVALPVVLRVVLSREAFENGLTFLNGWQIKRNNQPAQTPMPPSVQ